MARQSNVPCATVSDLRPLAVQMQIGYYLPTNVGRATQQRTTRPWRLRKFRKSFTRQMEGTHGRLHGQRSAQGAGRRSRYAAALDSARASQTDGHEIRLRHRL